MIPASTRACNTSLPQAKRASSSLVNDWFVRSVRSSANAELTSVSGAIGMTIFVCKCAFIMQTTVAQAVKTNATGATMRAVVDKCLRARCGLCCEVQRKSQLVQRIRHACHPHI